MNKILRRLILIDPLFYIKGRYDFRGLRRVPGRRNAFSKFRNLGNNRVCPFRSYFTDFGIQGLSFSVLCSTLIALSVAAFLPMINTFGIAVTNVLCAVLVWITFMYVNIHFSNSNYFLY